MSADRPGSLTELREHLAWSRRRYPDDPGIVAGYLCGECGVHPLDVLSAARKEWPAVVQQLYVPKADSCRVLILTLRFRQVVMAFLCESEDLADDERRELLEEWDAFQTPEQLPKPTRERALARYNSFLDSRLPETR